MIIPVLSPAMWKAAGAVALVAAVVAGGAAYRSHVYHLGYNDAVSVRKEQDAKKKEEDTKTANAETARLQAEAEQKAIERQQKEAKYEATIKDLRAAALRGNSGMRLPGPSISACPAREGSSVASGPSAESGYVLLPETSASVLDAASDLAASVRRINALIVEYDKCRASVNKD